MRKANQLTRSKQANCDRAYFSLVEIAGVAEVALKNADGETESAGYIIRHSLAFIQQAADIALQEASGQVAKDRTNEG
ncbi:TPA: hypothetical protein G8O67_004758 [Salmonella enterica]|uniref:Uncharacterized protein n=1 Tax=Salmonella enterica TaxID=28901 RepID=A0A756I8V6_SALER|nr:hypothetical protein [Salmonella enterica]